MNLQWSRKVISLSRGFVLVMLTTHCLAVRASEAYQLGPRPLFLVEKMPDTPLKKRLQQCSRKAIKKTDFSIAHRGAPLQFPEHTKESYLAAAAMGAGILECDVTFTKDRELVCRHSQCDLHTTTNILAVPELAAKCKQGFTPFNPVSGEAARARCCTSDITLKEYKSLCGKMDAANSKAPNVEQYLNGTAGFRTDLYSECGTLMTHKESISLFKDLGVKMTPELKTPSVAMPFEGEFTQQQFAREMIAEYREMKVPASDVFAQSFLLDDVLQWIKEERAFGRQAVYLDGRYGDPNFDISSEKTWQPSMTRLKKLGVRYLAPPMWMLLDLDKDKTIVASTYAKAAKKAKLDLITWTIERSGLLKNGGGWYYQTLPAAITTDGNMYEVLHVLAEQVGIKGIFSDWPATVSYYASCMDKK